MVKPPIANQRPAKLEAHGNVREDPYFWLNQREDPDVIAYLEAENAYTEEVMAHTEQLQETLFEEIKGRLVPDDASVPYRKDDFYYYYRFEEGREYAIHCRKRDSLDAAEEVLVDGNALAHGHDYFSLHLSGISIDHNLLAFAIDTQGRRIYDVYFKNLGTGELLDDRLGDVTGSVAWANDNETVFYSKQHPNTLRSYQVFRHRLGSDPADDVLVFEETDETFHVDVFKTKSRRFIMVTSEQTLTSEVRFLPADEPEGDFRVVQPRERKHEYSVSHFDNDLFILTNDDAVNFRLMKTSVERPGKEHWEELIPHRADVLLETFTILRDYLVLVERHQGLRKFRIRSWDGSDEHYLDFDEPAYSAYPTQNVEFDTTLFRFAYTSLTTPQATYDYDVRTRERTRLKQDKVLGDFEQSRYVTERVHATADDGTLVPISLVYRKQTPLGGKSPLLLHGYGSYGITMEASFSAARLSLLDRGFVYAIAHIRGGEDLGRPWYDQGKLLAKKNTFTDFAACAEHLVAHGYADPERLFASGGSAGGLLVGAVMNLRPDLFTGIVAHVPFVDIVTTMLDESIPLTTGEYDEWGDPNDKKYYDYMMSYSPYDNVEPTDYPHLLVTTGLHDSQVQYWEPAKWVAKLRAMKTDNHRLVMKTNMEAGHHGASGRFEKFRETALAYAFLLDLVE
jgi:oligopeptidase B